MTNIHCKYDTKRDPETLKDNPKNRNKHTAGQIDRLADLYAYHGIRHPIIISNQSGFIVSGHARKAAAIKAGLKEFPVVFQDFDSPEAEYAFMVSDNAIADWAEIDLAGINIDIPDLGPEFDLDMLGIKDFVLDVFEKHELDEKPEKEKLDKFLLEVELPTHDDLVELHQDLSGRGLIVRIK